MTDETLPDAVKDDEEEFDPEQIERDLTAFIEGAEPLAGPPVAQLADDVAARLRTTWSDIEVLMAEVAHNKLLATMLLVSQRARELQPDDPEQWRLHAASSLLSGMIGVRHTEFQLTTPPEGAGG